jgi:ammonia channel protein AmtB
LCGLVAITGNCAYIMAWAAIVIGGLAPIFYALFVRICNRLKIDDAAEAF